MGDDRAFEPFFDVPFANGKSDWGIPKIKE